MGASAIDFHSTIPYSKLSNDKVARYGDHSHVLNHRPLSPRCGTTEKLETRHSLFYQTVTVNYGLGKFSSHCLGRDFKKPPAVATDSTLFQPCCVKPYLHKGKMGYQSMRNLLGIFKADIVGVDYRSDLTLALRGHCTQAAVDLPSHDLDHRR